jgi:hypothetical protein
LEKNKNVPQEEFEEEEEDIRQTWEWQRRHIFTVDSNDIYDEWQTGSFHDL